MVGRHLHGTHKNRFRADRLMTARVAFGRAVHNDVGNAGPELGKERPELAIL